MGDVNKKKYFYRKSRNKYFLEPGYKGFFCTCNFREKDCVKEAYNILNEYADKLFPNGDVSENVAEEKLDSSSNDEDDIGDLLKKELENMKNDSKKALKHKRFQAVETGASNCIFVKTNLPNPEVLTSAIFTDLTATKLQKTRHLLRLVPIMSTCKASLPDIMESAGKLFDKYFLKEPSTFAVIFNKRFNNSVSRDLIIRELAELVTIKNSGNKADLKNPKYAIVIEIIKGMCLVSIVENYFAFRKYNLIEICKAEVNDDEDETKAKKVKSEDNTVEAN